MLTVEDKRRFLWLRERRLAIAARESLYEFARQAWHTVEPKNAFVGGWHIGTICEHLEAVRRGEIRNLLINMPPRHMKSLLTSVLWPAWSWTDEPELRWLYGSYAGSLAIRDSVKTRRVIQSPWYQASFGDVFTLRGDQNEKRKFENDKGGHRIATSVGGAGTGEGGDILVIDDPNKAGEAHSKHKLERANEWLDTEIISRGNDQRTVRRVVVQQRIAEGDASGHILEQGGWEHLVLPAEFETKRERKYTAIGWTDPRTEEGELLWPERFGKPEIEELKKMGAKAWGGQGQQRPAPEAGIIFKREWFKNFYTELPQMDVVLWSWDLTFDEGKKNDFVVGQKWGRAGARFYLLKEVRAKMAYVAQRVAVRAAYHADVALGVESEQVVEKAANGAAMLSDLAEEIPALIPIKPTSSKASRAEAQSPLFEAGNVWLPDPSIWPGVQDYIEEHVAFPNALHDDRVDATSQALSRLRLAKSLDWEPVSLQSSSKWTGR